MVVPSLLAVLSVQAGVLSATPHTNATNGTTPGARECKPLPSWGWPVGVGLGSVASVGINIGQNMQADGIRLLPEADQMKPWKSTVWIIGETVFITCSMVNFGALALAPASVLVPLESIQFVTNVAYSRLVAKATIPPKMLLGVFLAILGTVLTVTFGSAGESCLALTQLEWAWTSALWWSYLAVTVSVALACLRVHHVYTERLSAGENPPHHELVLPITFTLSSALLGGSQMIVQSKVFSELLSMLLQGELAVLSSGLLYVALVLVILCGMIWMVRAKIQAAPPVPPKTCALCVYRRVHCVSACVYPPLPAGAPHAVPRAVQPAPHPPPHGRHVHPLRRRRRRHLLSRVQHPARGQRRRVGLGALY